MQRIMYLDQDFFDRPENSSGAITSKLSSVPNALQELIGANLMLLFIVMVNIISSSVLAIAYGWKLGLVVVFGGLPLLLGSGYAKIRLDQRLEILGEYCGYTCLSKTSPAHEMIGLTQYANGLQLANVSPTAQHWPPKRSLPFVQWRLSQSSPNFCRNTLISSIRLSGRHQDPLCTRWLAMRYRSPSNFWSWLWGSGMVQRY